MLIVEGPDLIGKTTFLDAVAQKLGAIITPVNREHFTAADKNMTPEKYSRRFKPLCLSDRAHMSNLVYGTVCRGIPGGELTPDQYRVIDGMMLAAGGLMVLFFASEAWYAELLDRHQERGEMYNRDQNTRVNNLFRAIGSREPVHGVRPWVDVAYHCDGEYPSASDPLVDTVADRYLSLLEAL